MAAGKSRGRDLPPELGQARLRYVSDHEPGILRVRHGRGFSYRFPDGTRVRQRDVLHRIRSLAVPPAWEEVWICGHAAGHLQATGRDARRRKQYRYHPEWSRARNTSKFDGMLVFGESLTDLRRAVQRDLRGRELTRQKVVAIAVALLDQCHIRVGNEAYERENHTYGLTTLKDRHVRIARDHLHLRFKAKGGQTQEVDVRDRRLAALVKRCRDLPGQDLFQYRNADGEPEPISSQDINRYLLEVTGHHFTAKDFRTWAGTAHATAYLWEAGPQRLKRQRKKKMVEAVTSVAGLLGNTPATCRKYYVPSRSTRVVLRGDLFPSHQSRAQPQRVARSGAGGA